METFYSYWGFIIWASKQERWITACVWSISHQSRPVVKFNIHDYSYANSCMAVSMLNTEYITAPVGYT